MKVGRPTDCDEGAITRCEKAARAGVTMRNMHKHARVDASTFWRWMSPDSTGKQAEFRERILAARCEREIECAERAAENGSKTGHAWMLERSFGYRADVDNDSEPPAGTTARSREEAIEQLAKLPDDLLLDAIRKKREGA